MDKLVELFLKTGFNTMEVTLNTPGATRQIEKLLLSNGSDLNIGAGTVKTEADLQRALDAGAQFIVTPVINQGVITSCTTKNIPVFPGAYTPTEVFSAWQLGATAVKIFPAVTGGLTHLKALKGPLDEVPMIPTGGVSADNLKDFLELGVFGVGMGSQLFPKLAVQQEDWQMVNDQMQKIIRAYKNWTYS